MRTACRGLNYVSDAHFREFRPFSIDAENHWVYMISVLVMCSMSSSRLKFCAVMKSKQQSISEQLNPVVASQIAENRKKLYPIVNTV